MARGESWVRGLAAYLTVRRAIRVTYTCRVTLSIIVPVFNESKRLRALGDELMSAKHAGCELIVVDGGSADESRALAAHWAHHVVSAPRGRALQMNAGARVAAGDVLLFLHADSVLPQGACDAIDAACRRDPRAWGRFDVTVQGRSAWFPVISWFINQRSRATGIATGDQGIFLTRAAFEAVGGFPSLPLMEDVAICKRLKRLARPVCLRQKMITSGRRWERHGVWHTIFLMWRLRFDYWRGVPAEALHARYYGPQR